MNGLWKLMKELGIEEIEFRYDGKRVLWFGESLKAENLSEEELKKVERILKWTFEGDEWWQRRNREVLEKMKGIKSDVLFREVKAELASPGRLELANANSFGRWIKLVFNNLENLYAHIERA